MRPRGTSVCKKAGESKKGQDNQGTSWRKSTSQWTCQIKQAFEVKKWLWEQLAERYVSFYCPLEILNEQMFFARLFRKEKEICDQKKHGWCLFSLISQLLILTDFQKSLCQILVLFFHLLDVTLFCPCAGSSNGLHVYLEQICKWSFPGPLRTKGHLKFASSLMLSIHCIQAQLMFINLLLHIQ